MFSLEKKLNETTYYRLPWTVSFKMVIQWFETNDLYSHNWILPFLFCEILFRKNRNSEILCQRVIQRLNEWKYLRKFKWMSSRWEQMTFLSIMCKCILPILHSKILVQRKQNSEFLSNNNSAIKWVEIFFVGYYSEGIPSEEALLSLYCDLTGNGLPLPNWKFFLGLVFFRVIVNIQVGSVLASAASCLSTVTMKLYLFSYSSSLLVSNVNQIKGHQWEYWSLSVRTVTTMTASGP